VPDRANDVRAFRAERRPEQAELALRLREAVARRLFHS
jgi:hypothetical protein